MGNSTSRVALAFTLLSLLVLAAPGRAQQTNQSSTNLVPFKFTTPVTIVPDVLVTGGGGAVEGLAAALMRSLNGNGHAKRDDAKDKPPVSHRK